VLFENEFFHLLCKNALAYYNAVAVLLSEAHPENVAAQTESKTKKETVA
jgi:hypothetical protein